MKTKTFFKSEKALAEIERVSKSVSLSTKYLASKGADFQVKFLRTVFSIKYGEDQFMTGAHFDVIDDLDLDVQKYGEKAFPLSEKQLSWVARELAAVMNIEFVPVK